MAIHRREQEKRCVEEWTHHLEWVGYFFSPGTQSFGTTWKEGQNSPTISFFGASILETKQNKIKHVCGMLRKESSYDSSKYAEKEKPSTQRLGILVLQAVRENLNFWTHKRKEPDQSLKTQANLQPKKAIETQTD